MRRNILLFAAAGCATGAIAAWFLRPDAEPVPAARRVEQTLHVARDRMPRPSITRPAHGQPLQGSDDALNSAPVISLQPVAETHVDWSDPARDPRWATAAEPVIHQLAAARLAIDHPGAQITSTTCKRRTCRVTLETPVEDADLVFDYLTLLFTVDGVSMKTSREELDEEMARLHLDLLLPEPGMDPAEIVRRQRQAEIDYPHLLRDYRHNLARLRAERRGDP